MESKDRQHNTQEGCVKAKVLPIERRVTDISQEPEMQELERMIRAGELDPDRTADYLKQGDDMGKGKDSFASHYAREKTGEAMGKGKDQGLKPYTIRLPEDIHRKLKMVAAKKGVTMHSIIEGLIRDYVKGMRG